MDKAYEKLEKKYKLLKERKEMSDVDQSVMDKELAEKDEKISNLKELTDKEIAEKDGMITKLKEELDDLTGKLTQVGVFSFTHSFCSLRPYSTIS